MTDPPGAPGDDIQRPLDESLPSEPPEPASGDPPSGEPPTVTVPDDQASLRPAVPAGEPAGEPAEVASAEVAGTPPARPGGLARLVRAGYAVGRAPRRAAAAAAGWLRRPSGRFALPGLLIAALLGAALATGAFLVPTGDSADPAGSPGPPGAGGPSGFPAPSAPPGVPPPQRSPGSVPTGLGNPADALADWAAQIRARTGIPEVALRAYGYADLAAGTTTPGCQLSWTTLAAIGRVESNHGSSSGATLLADGRALPPIFGLPLDGQGDRAEILDTDGGTLDRDPTYDRAVGPMQFIPSTWESEAVDATGDGIGDVHNIYDSALAAANYLCRGGRDLSSAQGWWSAVLSYNAVQSYAEAVYAAANDYGLRSRSAG